MLVSQLSLCHCDVLRVCEAFGFPLCFPDLPLERSLLLFKLVPAFAVGVVYAPRYRITVALSLGLLCGKIVLSVAVLAILITAPLGAIGIDLSYKRLLENNSDAG